MSLLKDIEPIKTKDFLKEKFPIESDRQAISAFSPTVCQYTSSPHGRASFTESVYAFSFDITGLKSPFHEYVLKNNPAKCENSRLTPTKSNG